MSIETFDDTRHLTCENGVFLGNSSAHSQTFSMATPFLTTPATLSLSLSTHLHRLSSSLSSTCFPFKPNLHRIRRNPHLYNHEDHHSTYKSLLSTRVLGPKSNFLQMGPSETSCIRETLVKSSASDSSNTVISTLSQKVSKFPFVFNKK